MDFKQHISKEHISQRRNFKRNFKIFWTKWKGKHNLLKFVGRGKFIALNAYIRKEKRLKSIVKACTLGNKKKKSILNTKWKEEKIIRIGTETYEIEHRKSMKPKAIFF